jgi:hypothetical protein
MRKLEILLRDRQEALQVLSTGRNLHRNNKEHAGIPGNIAFIKIDSLVKSAWGSTSSLGSRMTPFAIVDTRTSTGAKPSLTGVHSGA